MSAIDLIETSTREFINCVVCNKDMQGVMEYVTEAGGRVFRPDITCMRCYYKDEIAELEKKK
jgi:hypothetical protein